mgnify:CR=1 FL=1
MSFSDLNFNKKRFSLLTTILLILTSLSAVALAKNTAKNNQVIPSNVIIDKVYVDKSERVLKLLSNDKVIKTYHIALGDSPVGHKRQEGDERTPTGSYKLDYKNENSSYYRSIHVSYPNAADKAQARKRGVSPGGDIMIHGSATTAQVNKLPKLMDYLPQKDWTWGCVAVRNVDMDEIWTLVDDGTIITIYP